VIVSPIFLALLDSTLRLHSFSPSALFDPSEVPPSPLPCVPCAPRIPFSPRCPPSKPIFHLGQILTIRIRTCSAHKRYSNPAEPIVLSKRCPLGSSHSNPLPRAFPALGMRPPFFPVYAYKPFLILKRPPLRILLLFSSASLPGFPAVFVWSA